VAALLDEVKDVCLAGSGSLPSEGEDLPGGRGGVLLDAHRALARAATLGAQAGETVMLAVVACARSATTRRCASGTPRRGPCSR
jgi:hypothetical protein